MKKLLILLLLISFSIQAEIFDLECVSIKPSHNFSETLKIIYESDYKDVIQNGKSLINYYSPEINATQNLQSLTVDDNYIKFEYSFIMDNEKLGKSQGIHQREISRATGLMIINAYGSGGFYDEMKTQHEPQYKCSKRKNEF